MFVQWDQIKVKRARAHRQCISKYKRERNKQQREKKMCPKINIKWLLYPKLTRTQTNWPLKWFYRQINYREREPKYALIICMKQCLYIYTVATVNSNTFTCRWPIETSVQPKEMDKRTIRKMRGWGGGEKTQHKYVQRDDGMVAMKLQSRHDSWASAHTWLGWMSAFFLIFHQNHVVALETLELRLTSWLPKTNKLRVARTGDKLAQNAKYARDTWTRIANKINEKWATINMRLSFMFSYLLLRTTLSWNEDDNVDDIKQDELCVKHKPICEQCAPCTAPHRSVRNRPASNHAFWVEIFINLIRWISIAF